MYSSKVLLSWSEPRGKRCQSPGAVHATHYRVGGEPEDVVGVGEGSGGALA